MRMAVSTLLTFWPPLPPADVDFYLVVDFRNHEDGSKGCVAARGLIEWGDAHEAVHASFSREQAVGVFAGKLDRCGLDARFFSGRLVKDGGIDAFAFRPAKVHAQQHGGPIL
jgi:hypothetical protein